MRIWKNDSEVVFNFREFEPVLRQFNIEELTGALSDKSKNFLTPEVHILHNPNLNSVIESYFVFPGGKAITISEENLKYYNFGSPQALEAVTIPVYYDSESDKIVGGEEERWKPRWVESFEPAKVALGGKTDFYLENNL